MSGSQPHEIRFADSSPAYRCRSCKTDAGLQWFKGTSCPVCYKQECIDALNAEWSEAYQAMNNEEEP